MSYNTRLQTNNNELDNILETINSLPEAGPSIIKLEYSVGTTIDTHSVNNAYEDGAYVCVEGDHSFTSKGIQSTATFSIPLVELEYNVGAEEYALIFKGADSYGNIIEILYHHALGWQSITIVKGDPVLQDITVTPNEWTQVFTPDADHDAIGTVMVHPIPDKYIVPSGTLEIIDNGSYDVSEKAQVEVNVQKGIDLPTLTSPANTSEVFKDKEYIDESGVKKTGTFTIENELSETDTLLTQIETALQGKASGGGTPTPTQEKNVEITENGTVEVTPDDGYVLSKVTANVSVTGSGADNSEEAIAAFLDNTMTELNNSIVTTLKTRACQASTKLVSVNLPNVTTLGSYAFYSCSGLVTAKLPKLTSVSTQVFYSCAKLQHADCGQLGNIPAQTFNACSALTELILRKTGSICTLSNVNGVNNTPIGKGTGYVYVPSVLVEDYKAYTNWSTFANQIRAIEDYPEICG